MVETKISLTGTLAMVAGDKEVTVNAGSLREALDALTERYGAELKSRLYDNNGKPRRFINIYVDGRDYRFTGRLKTRLNEGSLISIIPAVSGG
jgi:molybdopterin synthase sulfur carrier subunit